MPAPGTRITAGTHRGRRLKTRSGSATRPTTALVRQALFNIIGDSIKGASVLDLFAGAGTLGIEALSRGAVRATFVDRERACANIVSENLAAMGFAQQGEVHCAPVVDWLKAHQGELSRYNLIVLDPPYRDADLTGTLAVLDRAPLRTDALLVIEHHRDQALPATERLRFVRQRDYGMTRLSFARYVP